jgi:hypothetical protein
MQTFICIILLAAIGFIMVFVKKKKNAKLQSLKDAYDNALRGNDKQKAVAAGRDYYGALRKNGLTTYDEAAINNDVSAMKV